MPVIYYGNIFKNQFSRRQVQSLAFILDYWQTHFGTKKGKLLQPDAVADITVHSVLSICDGMAKSVLKPQKKWLTLMYKHVVSALFETNLQRGITPTVTILYCRGHFFASFYNFGSGIRLRTLALCAPSNQSYSSLRISLLTKIESTAYIFFCERKRDFLCKQKNGEAFERCQGFCL